jgi:thiosulfate/3-mercaptopyruvate sulfurtransferase
MDKLFTTTISAPELANHLKNPAWAVIDCRFRLLQPEQGYQDYQARHIPGAIYAHLDHDLSGPVVKGVTGRHPLPSVEKISEVFSGFGIDENVQVVAYDDLGGALAAVRVWWLLRWLGHEAVTILDGGWQEWLKRGYPVAEKTVERRQRRKFIAHPRNELFVSSKDIEWMRRDPDYRVLDARSADRYRGENETIDPVAGHIPGAISAPYGDNLNPDGTFQSEQSLADRYKMLVNGVPIEHVVCYCGSGITSAHNILAMMMAGMGEARLYAGSYSEWITDPKHLVEK